MNYGNVLRIVFNTPWAILPETYRQICQVVRRRCLEGERFEEEKIRETIGTKSQRQCGLPTLYLPSERYPGCFNVVSGSLWDLWPAAEGSEGTADAAEQDALTGQGTNRYHGVFRTKACGEDDGPRGPQPHVVAPNAAGNSKLETRNSAQAVAVLPLYGIMGFRANLLEDTSSGIGTSVELYGQWFAAALADPTIGAIVQDIDSPGGSVEGLLELFDLVMSARGVKPVISIANAMAASAAYFVAAAGSELVVTPSGMVGSIGTVMEHADFSAFEAQKGIKTTFVYAGEYKVEGNSSEPLGDVAKAEFQRIVDAYYAQFVGAVARGRGVTPATVVSRFKSGRMAMANEAVELGMADRVDTMAGVLTRLGIGGPNGNGSAGGISSPGMTRGEVPAAAGEEDSGEGYRLKQEWAERAQ